MKQVKGQPITASRVSQSRKAPFVPDAKETSANAQTMISEPPAPFKNKMTTAQQSTGQGGNFGSNLPVSKPRSGLQHTSPGARALPQRGPVGQRRPINQSGQVNGRMGTSFPRKVGQNGQGYPVKKNARFYGE
jgi:hypothetical protein